MWLVTQKYGTASRGTEAPVKKAKIILTEKEQAFASLFQSDESKIDKPRKIDLRHASESGAFLKRQGTRKHDVSYVYWLYVGLLLRNGFRNRLKCHLLSLLSLITVNGINYHFHLLHTVYGIPLMTEPYLYPLFLFLEDALWSLISLSIL